MEKRIKHQINHQIKVKEVRLIDLPEGQTNGIYPIEVAMKLARDQGLDLIQVSVNTSPCVCKIMEYSKFKYELEKKEKELKKKQKIISVKEIRLSQNIGENDLQTKVRQSIEFLKRGDKLKAYVFFKGREIAFKKQGEIVLFKFASLVEEFGVPEKLPNLEGKTLSFIIKPKK